MAIEAFKSWLRTAGLREEEHQLEGLRWCLDRELKVGTGGIHGGIIADEMGLGKTILMLGCILSNFHGPDGIHRTLVVLPKALLLQWDEIVQRFFGHEALIYHGRRLKKITAEQLIEAPIVLTTYGMISKRAKESPLWKMRWHRLIFDEAHHMRNGKTAIFLGAKKLQAQIKWLVTGTPIQNRNTDFYSLCAMLGLETAFYANPANIPNIIREYLLRRTKKSVGIQLPPITVENILVDWKSSEEKELAAQIHSLSHFTKATLANVDMLINHLCGQGNPLPLLTRARQACISPHLLHQAVGRMIAKGQLAPDVRLRAIKTCSKITAIVDHIRRGLASDPRRCKMIFCHYRGEIDLLEAMLQHYDISCTVVDGRTGVGEKRLAFHSVLSKADWCSISKNNSVLGVDHLYDVLRPFMVPSVMIVQIQTACEGLNMQHFHDIYFVSPHWNPAVEDQAIARAHRIGQNAEVRVYRFIMRQFEEDDDDTITLDQYCHQVQEKKRELMRIFNA